MTTELILCGALYIEDWLERRKETAETDTGETEVGGWAALYWLWSLSLFMIQHLTGYAKPISSDPKMTPQMERY